ncbi:deoxynucleoside kinase [Echinicola sediminis]
MHIAITGNIGSGKSTLAQMLGKHFGWYTLLEDVEENPYLKDFYSDMEKWSFHLQVYFLGSRFKQIQQIMEQKRPTIQDRTIYEDGQIFAANLHQSGLMSDRDYFNYQQLFQSMMDFIKAPDLLVYLQADIPKLVNQIEKRARSYESLINIQYLKNLNNRYEDWISGYQMGKVITINVNQLDFVANPKDFELIVKKIEAKLPKLSP